MKVLKYKGIVFDEFAEEADGCYWAEICSQCATKYWDAVHDVVDDGGTAFGCCSVMGCYNSGEDQGKLHYYIDFDGDFIEIADIAKSAK